MMSEHTNRREAVIPLIMALAVSVMPVDPVSADPMEDICHSRARSESGYRKPIELTTSDGRARVRVSGSVSVGVSSSRGASNPGGVAPPFAGSASTERREQERAEKSAAKYQRIYDYCMTGR